MPTFQPRAIAAMPALALLLLQPATFATHGTVTGRVIDPAGLPVPNAQVIVIGTSRATSSDASGRYRILRVPAGTISLSATRTGYRPGRADNVIIRSGDTTRVNITLAPAPVRPEDVARAQPAVPRNEADAKHRMDGRYPQATAEASVGAGGFHDPGIRRRREPWNTEEYSRIYDNRFHDVLRTPVSTFSIDVDRASYGNVRRFLSEGRLPPKDAVRIEELVNYFSYEYAEPTGRHPFTVATDLGPAPWNSKHRLLRIGLQGRRYAARELPPSNLVFLIDVSGSMQSPDKLPLVKQAFRVLVNELRPEDRVAMVVYAGSAGLVLPPTSGSERETILAALERLEAGGSTAGGAGIRLAYDVARRHFVREGNNRVILATDGDFNVGVSSEGELVRLIEQKRAEGTYLTVLGFGTGNYKDARLEQLADKGNGNYAYIDTFMEAQKVFGTELTATLFTIARDVKLQVEFNPARVRGYRLIGYENRLLEREDFNDDTKDAGELGAGHTVTALYEIVPAGVASDALTGSVDPLRYQREERPSAGRDTEWLTVKLRYKPLDSDHSRLLVHAVEDRDENRELTGDFAFAAGVAAFGMTLRESEHRGTASFGQALALARRGRGADEHGYRAEFIRLVETAQSLGIAMRGEPRPDE
jgi:Ca-activated chloride channel family protein